MSIVSIQFQGLRELGRLSREFEKQLPYAVSNSLNTIAFKIQSKLKREELSIGQHKLIIRNRFTASQLQVEKATKNSLQSVLGFTEKAAYMEKLDKKESRHARNKYIPIPTSAARAGKSPLRLVSKPNYLSKINIALAGSKHFILPLRGGEKLGIFKRVAKGRSGLVLLYILQPFTTYKKAEYFNFIKEVTQAAIQVDFEAIMMTNLLRAIRR